MKQLKIGKRINEQVTVYDEMTKEPPMYVFEENLDTSLYYDITSIYSWANIAQTYKDFIFCRNQMYLLTESIGWSSLTNDEKYTVSINFIVDKQHRDEVLTEEQQKFFWKVLINRSYNSRLTRWENAKSYMSYHLTPIDSSDIAKTTKILSEDYIDYNIKTLTEDGVDGLFDWITNTNNFSIGSGFNSKPYWSQIHQDNLIKILRDGIY